MQNINAHFVGKGKTHMLKIYYTDLERSQMRFIQTRIQTQSGILFKLFDVHLMTLLVTEDIQH